MASLKDFIALAKKQAGKMNAASGGTGTANHLVLEMFKQRAGFFSAEITAAIKSPEMRDFMLKEGADPVGSTPQEFAAYFKSEVQRYAAVIRAGNIRVE